MPKNDIESGQYLLRPSESRKIIIAKCVLGLFLVCSLDTLVTHEKASLSDDLIDVSALFSAFFGYLNLLNVKSELIELFEPPYPVTGCEFIFVAFTCNIISFFV